MRILTTYTETDKNIFELQIPVEEVAVSEKDIFNEIGYGIGEIDAHFSEIAKEITTAVPGKIKIKAGYRLVEFKKPENKNNGFLLDDVFFETHKIVTGQLKKSENAAIFVCTIGPDMEEWSKEAAVKGEPLESYFIDAAASAIAEKCADYIHAFISKKMERLGLKITNRYSPGYCQWSVSEQQKLFSLLPEGFCGIKLTESSLMKPVKSVSGIIGIGKDVKWNDYQCGTCGVKDCTYGQKKRAKENKQK